MAKTKTNLEALLGAPTEQSTKEVYLKRLDSTFEVRELTSREYSSAVQEAKKGQLENFDELNFGVRLVALATVDSPFTNAELMMKVGAMDPEECVEKTLKYGEIMELSGVISELSGMVGEGELDGSLIEDAKN